MVAASFASALLKSNFECVKALVNVVPMLSLILVSAVLREILIFLKIIGAMLNNYCFKLTYLFELWT